MTFLQKTQYDRDFKIGQWVTLLVFTLVAPIVFFDSPLECAAATVQEPVDGGDSRLADTASRAQNTGGNFAFAARQWEKLITDYPDSSLVGKAHFNAGICQIQTTEFHKAIRHLQSAIPKLEDEAVLKPHASLYLGFAQFKLGQSLKQEESTRDESTALLNNAIETFKILLKANPKFSAADQACYFQGGALEELGRHEEAIDAYTKVFTFSNPTFKFDGLFALADLQFQMGHFDLALKYCEQFRAEAEQSGGHSSLDEINLLSGKALAKLATADEVAGNSAAANEKLAQAVDFFKQVSEQDPAAQSNSNFQVLADEALFQQAFCTVRLKQYADAAKLYEKIAANPDSPFAAESLAFAGHSLVEAGETEKAIDTLKKSVATNSQFSRQAAHWLAGVYLKTDQPQKAFDLASEWIPKSSGQPAEVALMMDQADAAYDIPEKRKESVALFDAIVDKHPNHKLAAPALYNSAVASLDTGDYGSAIETVQQFETSFENSSYLPDALDVKAEAYLLSNQLDQAASTLTRLTAAYPQHKKIAYWKLRSGLALYLNGKFDETIGQLTPILESLETPAEKSEALHWIGASQFQLKEFEEAAEALSLSNQTDATWRRADETLLLLCRSQLAIDQLPAAQATANSLIDQFPKSKTLNELHFRLGEQAYDTRQYETAFENFNRIIQSDIDSSFLPFSLYNAAWSQLELKNFDESDDLFTRLIDEYPDHEVAKRAVIGRSAARRKTGDPQSSISDLEKLLENALEKPQQLEAGYELGLAQVQAAQWDGAIETFQRLLEDFPEDPRLDRFYYELAWAHKAKKQDDKALALFSKISQDFNQSSFAAEANFHIAKSAYDAENYDEAIKAFTLCIQSDAVDGVREKAAYKLAWAHYKQDQFQLAHDQFVSQVDSFPDGDLHADGMFMVAESLFRLKQYEPAFAAYLAAQPVVKAATKIEPKIKWLTMLHGAQCGNKIKKFEEALQLVSPLPDSNADSAMKQDAWLEMGTAYDGLGDSQKAIENWEKATGSLGKTGARAFCMIGDHYFANKRFTEAINQFQQVRFGFRGTDAEDDVRPWQAYAIYEAARCNFVQVKQAPKESKSKLVNAAIEQFEFLLEHYSDDRLAPEARKQLETLKKIKLD